MSDYDIFAEFYDAVIGDRPEVMQRVQNYIEKKNPTAKNILEIACGTGTNLKYLSKKYRVSGLELSKEMLNIAQEKNPTVTFYAQDMRDFKIDERFDVILCLFDSINHLVTFDDWVKVFQKTTEHLNDKGIFIFDINTSERLEKLSASPAQVREFDSNYLIMKVVKKGQISNWEVKVFEKKSATDYTLHSEVISEVSFDKYRIQRELKKFFKDIEIDIASKLDTGDIGRLYFICQK